MQRNGLYDPRFEHDACGVGFVGYLDGAPRHDVIEKGLAVLANLAHRGASGADSGSGDGAGILLALPDAFFRARFDCELPGRGAYGFGMAFLPPEPHDLCRCRDIINATAHASGWRVLGWRETPVDPQALGASALACRPAIRQFVVAPLAGSCAEGAAEPAGDALERGLLLLRKDLTRAAQQAGFSADRFYIVSLSSRTVIYKGMMMAGQVERFYPDLADPELASPFAVVHQRYSTNTFPSWRLAQPFRCLAHNGEINTIRGNRNWLAARESHLASPLFGKDMDRLFPLIEPASSDSASLDNALEFLMRGGRGLDHSMAMLIPQAWGDKYPMGPDLRGFFEFHAGLMEPWDGPAAVVFTDGIRVGACLDRNGLRPARYTVTRDGLVVLASESGVLDIPASRVLEKGALGPGRMLVADFSAGRLFKNAEIKSRLSRLQPYRRWVSENRIDIPGFFSVNTDFSQKVAELPFVQTLFGYTRDDTNILLTPMAAKGQEPIGSMGADVPLAVLDDQPQSLFNFFRQQFAQITNPPIDPIREELVMSLMTFIGYHPNILLEEPGQSRLIKLRHPILSNDDLTRLEELKHKDFHSVVLDSAFDRPLGPPRPGSRPGRALARALARLEFLAEEAVTSGAGVIVISDRKADADRLPIPSLLAVAAVNRKLVDLGNRARIGLVCETGEAREVNHIAMLLSLGAAAVNPWLAFETVGDLATRGKLPDRIGPSEAIENYVHALCRGLLKIMSKMGISTLRGYRGAQIFEAVGLGRELMDAYFPAIVSRVGGIGLEHLERDALRKRERAVALQSGPAPSLPDSPEVSEASKVSGLPGSSGPLPVGGSYRYRKDGEKHLWTPESIGLLQRAVRENNRELFNRYACAMDKGAGQAFTLRGLLDIAPGKAPVPLDEVEPVEFVMRRFVTGAMSFGSLSKEAHETLASAMNGIGARSNCGEGGEDPARYALRPDGANVRSAVKQVASGRFGVTLEYLVNADELQIKIAQGAKPGEGGQLPGHKVDAEIARVRHSTPGVTLISPPPHHDIYSIEDIAQLIYDLYQVNDEARVSVKLASEVGVGTIAAGVAKAMAGSILISGFDGGTGASPLSSIMHAGSPWEIGLAETQQTLVLNGLRGRVRLQADGQMKTARDVVVASLLGADEFGFATAPLICLGCVMMRKCHTNGCPVGVATQDPKLRARFKGRPEHVVNFFRFIAEDVRKYMARLGFRSMDEMTGQVGRLVPDREALERMRERGLDFSALLAEPGPGARRYMGAAHDVRPAHDTLDDALVPLVEQSMASGAPLERELALRNTDRAVGAKISSRMARGKSLPPPHGLPGTADSASPEGGFIRLRCTGVAGQSFGAFAARGLTLALSGEANDYVGKGLSGGRIIIKPPVARGPDEHRGHETPGNAAHHGFDPEANIIAGNVALYGATSGELYLCGRAGERFAVRNSGAHAVVEGVGDHGCEYMTGGRVVILGLTGVNFGAGMSGGLAYVYDEDGLFDSRCNLAMIDLDLPGPADEAELKAMLERHAAYTGSRKAKAVLDNWDREKGRFVKVFPMEYRRALGEMSGPDADTPRKEGVAS